MAGLLGFHNAHPASSTLKYGVSLKTTAAVDVLSGHMESWLSHTSWTVLETQCPGLAV